MARYRPDHKLAKAKNLIESLDDSEESELIKYYIQDLEKDIKKQSGQLSEYRDFFRKLSGFLPNSNIVYGSGGPREK